MKGLVCEYCGTFSNHEKVLVLCVSDVHAYGVTVTNDNGENISLNPDSLKIVKPEKIPPIFDDWRVQMGFESWNQYAD